MKLFVLFTLAAMAGGDVDGCGCDDNSADSALARKTESSMRQVNAEVGMPAIHNFTERRLAKTIYEMRDDAKLRTWTYLVALDNKLTLLCPSIGYGLPYATQFTNPERFARETGHYDAKISQPEPNGLFMPSAAEATWVLCVDKDGDPKPVYVEPRIVVSPFELQTAEAQATAPAPTK